MQLIGPIGGRERALSIHKYEIVCWIGRKPDQHRPEIRQRLVKDRRALRHIPAGKRE